MHGTSLPRQMDRHGGRASHASTLLLWAALGLIGYLGLTAYEALMLGLPAFPYEPALFTPYYLARSIFALTSSGMIVWIMARGAPDDSSLRRANLNASECLASAAIMLAALGAVGIYLVSPGVFEELAAEDGFIEWSSAAFALAGSAILAAGFWRLVRNPDSGRSITAFRLAVLGSLCVVFFLIGMEEISWMQRVVGFDTPAGMVDTNWQDEFNLHNFQTYLAETLYYSGAAALLIVLPLLREAAPGWRLLRPIIDFLPARFVVAVSAPISIFNYGHWNVIPIQMTVMITVCVLLAYAVAGARRRSRLECLLFAFLASAVVAGQAAFLAYGDLTSHIPNTEEFKEFFIALGLAGFAMSAFKSSVLAMTGNERAYPGKPAH